MSSTSPSSVAASEPLEKPRHPLAGRLMSLDLFRGATIAGMILVNNPGDEQSAYWPLKHAEWNGWTPTDLVFPFFLFIVGVAMAFSFSSRLQRGESRQQLMAHVLWRGLVLFALGLFLNGFPNQYHLATWLLQLGVLRFGFLKDGTTTLTTREADIFVMRAGSGLVMARAARPVFQLAFLGDFARSASK